jgi:UDP-3-O-[3-hydroxymyristoyl] glucosamine N-acyltransferase
VTLGQVAQLLGLQPPPNADRPVRRLTTLADASPDDLAFLASIKHLSAFRRTRALAVVVTESVEVADPHVPLLRVQDAELAVAAILPSFAPATTRPDPGVDPLARVASTAAVEAGARIGAFVTIGPGSSIATGAILHPGVRIGSDVRVGPACELFDNVVIHDRCELGSRVVIHANSVVGGDGFGYRWDGVRHAKIPHIGNVVIEDDVEIGSCTCIDRAKFGTTRIGAGVRIDNHVQIAHNVEIGAASVIVAQAGVAGSTRLGRGVVIAGAVAVRDNLTIGDRAVVGAMSGVSNDLEGGQTYLGIPARPHREAMREVAATRKLHDFFERLRALEKKLDHPQD